MSDYITDPELLAKLNGTNSDGYITDPAVLAELNKKSAKERLKEEIRSVADQGLTGVTDVANRGLVGGILGAPVDLVNLGVKGVHALTNAAMSPMGYENKWQPSEAPVGGSEWFGKQMQNMGMVSPERRPMLEAAAGLAPIAPGAVKSAYNVGKAVAVPAAEATKGLASVAMHPVEATKGVAGGLFNTVKPASAGPVKPWETASARMPVGETYIPANVLEEFRKGNITAEQAQGFARPSSELPQAALKRTQGMVPYAGQEIRAAGEQLGAGYRDPYKAVAELGTDYLLGGVPSAVRGGLKLYDTGRTVEAYKQLGKAGLSPLTPQEAAILSKAPGPVVPQGPAQVNAQSLGIAPPMTAEQSGFSQQLNSLSKGPVLPPNTMNMVDADKNKFFNQIKSSSESELERKVAGMSQANRDKLYQTMVDAGADEKTLKPFRDIFEKYRTKK